MADDRPKGELVDLSKPCVFPPGETIRGKLVELTPLQPEHAEELFVSIGGTENAELYYYMGYGPFAEYDAFYEHISQHSSTKDPQMYVIRDNASGKLVGVISYLRIDPSNRVIEIGHVMYSPSLQRTTQATELFYLLAGKAFEYGYRRLEWKCDSHNSASYRAAIRLGHTFEGVFRQHMIRKGRNRDSAWFSILDGEWPDRKVAFEAWMDESNFDGNGKQQRKLESFREGKKG